MARRFGNAGWRLKRNSVSIGVSLILLIFISYAIGAKPDDDLAIILGACVGLAFIWVPGIHRRLKLGKSKQ